MRAFIAAIQATRKRMRSHLLTGALLALVTIVPTITPLTAQPADNSAYLRRLYHDARATASGPGVSLERECHGSVSSMTPS